MCATLALADEYRSRVLAFGAVESKAPRIIQIAALRPDRPETPRSQEGCTPRSPSRRRRHTRPRTSRRRSAGCRTRGLSARVEALHLEQRLCRVDRSQFRPDRRRDRQGIACRSRVDRHRKRIAVTVIEEQLRLDGRFEIRNAGRQQGVYEVRVWTPTAINQRRPVSMNSYRPRLFRPFVWT